MKERTIVHVECNSIYHKLFPRELKDHFGDTISYAGFFDHFEALDFLRINRASLIISCIKMQGDKVCGFEFLRQCKILWPDIPFLMYTAMSYRDDFGQSGVAADAYVIKSSDPSELIGSIRGLLEKKAEHEFAKMS